MGLNRRQAMLAALGTLSAMTLGGCSSATRSHAGRRPTAPWDGYPASPSANAGYTPVQPPRAYPQQPIARPGTAPTKMVTPAGVYAIPRAKWTRSGPVRGKVNKMTGVNKITIHHEGWKPVYFADQRSTAARIEKVRSAHVNGNGWGDIGYHYIIDRAGRVWEGRPMQYQGAHVKNNNPNNLGILVLGNFEKQTPSDAQLQSLFKTTASLKKQHRVRAAMVRSHREINPTSCPGKNLQRQMDTLRRYVG